MTTWFSDCKPIAIEDSRLILHTTSDFKRKMLHDRFESDIRAALYDLFSSDLDLLILAPCTGNTLAKIAAGITDSSVTMAAKAHLRRDRPLLIALASNDAMSQNLHNVALLLQRKAVWFLPMKQDDPEKKPHSLVAEYERMSEGVAAAMAGKQLFPLFL